MAKKFADSRIIRYAILPRNETKIFCRCRKNCCREKFSATFNLAKVSLKNSYAKRKQLQPIAEGAVLLQVIVQLSSIDGMLISGAVNFLSSARILSSTTLY